MTSKEQIKMLLKLLQEADNAIQDMKSENRIHGHITDASANYAINIQPRIQEAISNFLNFPPNDQEEREIEIGHLGEKKKFTREEYINSAVDRYMNSGWDKRPDSISECFKEKLRINAAECWDQG